MKSIDTDVMQLESELLQPACRSDPQRIAALLCDDFLEVGATGRSFGKADTLARLPQETGITLVATDMRACHLAQNVVLVTYQASRAHLGRTTHSKRSSLWVKGARGWQMRYHQGTYSEPSHAA